MPKNDRFSVRIAKVGLTTEYTEHTEKVWMDGRVLRVVCSM